MTWNSQKVYIVFVHGTGVRKDRLRKLAESIKTNLDLPDRRLIGCDWGENDGSRCPEKWLSVPEELVRVSDDLLPNAGSVAMWLYLEFDPLIELKFLREGEKSEHRPDQEHFDTADLAIRNLSRVSDGELPPSLESPLTSCLPQGAIEVMRSGFADGLVGDDGDEYAEALARATIAFAWRDAPLSLNWMDAADLQGSAKDLANELRPQAKHLGDYFKAIAKDAALHWATGKMRKKRPLMTSKISAPIGDVLVYQARGQDIRNRIREAIATATARATEDGIAEPSIVLVGHSLGAIASFDLMVLDEVREQVKLFISVGTQISILYEMNALVSLAFQAEGSILPKAFPRWRNFYDRADFLSYTADHFFGEGKDVEICSGVSFPESHSHYWENDEFYQKLRSIIPQ